MESKPTKNPIIAAIRREVEEQRNPPPRRNVLEIGREVIAAAEAKAAKGKDKQEQTK